MRAADAPYGLNVFLPCPAGPDADKLSHAPWPDVNLIRIVQQRPVDGLLWTVAGCAWCGALWRLDVEHATLLAAHLAASYPGDELRLGIAERMMAGYVDGAGRPDLAGYVISEGGLSS